MKTTVDIADGLLQQAKDAARRQRRTLKSLLEEGLRRVLADQSRPPRKRIKPVVVKGKTPSDAFAWSRMGRTLEEDEDNRLGRSGDAA